MADQDQEITQTLRYRGVVDTSDLQLQTQATTQAIMGQQQGMLSGYLSGLKTGLASPIQEAFGFPRAEVSAGARMTLKQDMDSGWANLRTSAREYTQEGFYRQMLFGTAPEYSSSGLMNRLFVQQQAAALPGIAGNQRDAAGMEALADQVMAPFAGMLGFQRRFQQTLMTAQQSGLGQYVYSPHQMLQADLQLGALTAGLNRVYRVSPQEAGQLYTGILAAGTPGADAQAVFTQAIRSQAMGVPLNQTMQTIGQVNNVNAFRATVGLGRVEDRPGQIASTAIFGSIIGQQLGDQNIPFTSADIQRINAGVQGQLMINGYSPENARTALKNSLQISLGARARNLDVDEIIAAGRQSELRQTEQEASSVRIANNLDMFNHFMDPKFMLRDALGMGSQMLPTEAFNRMQRFLGYAGPNELSSPTFTGNAVTAGSLGVFSRYGSSLGQMAKHAQLSAYSDQLKAGSGLFGLGGTNPQQVYSQYIQYGGNAADSERRSKGLFADAQLVAKSMGTSLSGKLLAAANLTDMSSIGGEVFNARLARFEQGGEAMTNEDRVAMMKAGWTGGNSTLYGELNAARVPTPAKDLYRSVFQEAGIGWNRNMTFSQMSANQNVLLGVNDFVRHNISREQLVDRINGSGGLTEGQRKMWMQRVDQLGTALEQNPMKDGVFNAPSTADNLAAAHLISASQHATSISGATMMARDPAALRHSVGQFYDTVMAKLQDDPKNSIFMHARDVLSRVQKHAEGGQMTDEDYSDLASLGSGKTKSDAVLRRALNNSMLNQAIATGANGAPSVDMTLASASLQASKALSALGMAAQALGAMPNQGKRS